jgi:hypothetical protein
MLKATLPRHQNQVMQAGGPTAAAPGPRNKGGGHGCDRMSTASSHTLTNRCAGPSLGKQSLGTVPQRLEDKSQQSS